MLIVIVNRNQSAYTMQLLRDLALQDTDEFSILLVDNGSEPSQVEDMREAAEMYDNVELVLNGYNRSLNHMWNEYSQRHEYVCMLNNDVRVTPNFVSDTLEVLDKFPNVGLVSHVTNNPAYQGMHMRLNVMTTEVPYRQGWDFTIRRKAFTEIPEQIKFFAGDNWIFQHLFDAGWCAAIVYSSPIIHYCAMTKRPKNISKKDVAEYKKTGKYRDLPHHPDCRNLRPTFKELK